MILVIHTIESLIMISFKRRGKIQPKKKEARSKIQMRLKILRTLTEAEIMKIMRNENRMLTTIGIIYTTNLQK